MPKFKSLIPNVFVSDMTRSFSFFNEILGFRRAFSVPDETPYDWVRLVRDDVSIDLYEAKAGVEEYPSLAGKPTGATAVLYIVVEDVESLHASFEKHCNIVMPLTRKFYGSLEFAIEDPDGYVITFAEPTQG